MVVATSVKHAVLAKMRWIKAEELGKYPLITFAKDTSTRHVIDNFFRKAGVTPRIAMEAATIKPLVKIDLGITIIPYRAIADEVKRKELHCLRIRNHKLTSQVGIVFQKADHLSKVLAELISLFKELRDTEI